MQKPKLAISFLVLLTLIMVLACRLIPDRRNGHNSEDGQCKTEEHADPAGMMFMCI